MMKHSDRYQLVRPIANDYEVYVVLDTRMNNRSLIMKMAAEGEISVLLTLRHPALAQLIDVIQDEPFERPSLVMEYIEGVTLHELLIEHDGSLPMPFALQLIDQLLDVVIYLHELSPPVLHLDLKLGNLLLDHAGKLRLIDFGAACEKHSAEGVPARFGTPGYAAPEQLAGALCEERTDLYSIGVILHAMLTGQLPPADGDPARMLPDGSPPALLHALRLTLARAREARPRSARQLRAKLAALAAASPAYVPHRRTRAVHVCAVVPRAGATFIAELLICQLPHLAIRDCGTKWRSSNEVAWTRDADVVLFVLHPLRAEWGADAAEVIQLAARITAERKARKQRTIWIANRDCSRAKWRENWLTSFPLQPMTIPEVELEDLATLQWNDKPIQSLHRMRKPIARLAALVVH